ncbi:cupin domain-containing protein [Microbacterium sp. No. 7]|uniref:cupin domain-containing protein n=1 Tax=Microbacterium sp. No. 7 TaxID=1714373 RepID=UPI0006D13E2A|nr:cupin domain-containing protein [Microbacterium sp. No. 7]ALJ19739.1 hypothetical protein AOA12_07405 [Microbacterium sp. No. 7]
MPENTPENTPGVNRRVVTGTNSEGKGTIVSDLPLHELPGGPGQISLLWRTEGWPIRNEGTEEASEPFDAVKAFTTSSTSFVVTRSHPPQPGEEPLWHTTNSIDYAYVVSGQVRFEAEDGSTVDLRAGDVIVDRGIAHRWTHLGDEVTVMLIVMVEAAPVGAGLDQSRDTEFWDRFGGAAEG